MFRCEKSGIPPTWPSHDANVDRSWGWSLVLFWISVDEDPARCRYKNCSIHIYLYIWLYIYIYIIIHRWIYTYVCVYIYLFIHMYVCMYIIWDLRTELDRWREIGGQKPDTRLDTFLWQTEGRMMFPHPFKWRFNSGDPAPSAPRVRTTLAVDFSCCTRKSHLETELVA